MYTYEQALLCLGYYPDIWYEATMFLQEASRILEEKGDVKTANTLRGETISELDYTKFCYVIEFTVLFERGISGLMKESKLLYFAYADFEEESRKFEHVKKIYDKLLQIEHINPTLVFRPIFVFLLIGYSLDLRSADEIRSTIRGS